MKIIKKVLFFAVIIAFVVGAVTLVKKKKKALAAASEYKERPTIVHVVSPKRGNLIIEKKYIGVVATNSESTMSAQLTAIIKNAYFRENKVVKKGDLLIQLDDQKWRDDITIYVAQQTEIKAKLSSAKIEIATQQHNVHFWESKNKRDQILVKGKSLSKESGEKTVDSLNVSRGNLEVAKNKILELNATMKTIDSQLAVAKTMLSYTKIYAPYDGIVTKRWVEPGDLATPGKPLISIESQNQFKICVDVIQSDREIISEQQPVSISGKKITAKITKIYPTINEHRMLTIEIALPATAQKEFKTGEYVNLSIREKELKNVYILPLTAINNTESKDNATVFIVKDGTLERKVVKILGRSETEFACEGVSENETIVKTPFLSWINLTEKKKVEIAK